MVAACFFLNEAEICLFERNPSTNHSKKLDDEENRLAEQTLQSLLAIQDCLPTGIYFVHRMSDQEPYYARVSRTVP